MTSVQVLTQLLELPQFEFRAHHALPSFVFTMGPSHKVELSAAANGVVTADAIKLVRVTPVLSYIHADHLNTPLRVVEPSTNQVLWSWDPAPFAESAPTGTFVFNHRFPGQFFDQETNLHYNYLRDYDPSTGRYIQSDPIGLWGGVNTYAYAENVCQSPVPRGRMISVTYAGGSNAY